LNDIRNMTEYTDNPHLEIAFKYLQYTNQNVFLTGKAGTGKTTFLHNLKGKSPKRMIVVAPTGVAAINAGGVTIHSFFQLPFGPFVPVQNQEEISASRQIRKFTTEKINIMRSLDLLVIDEISMVRADVLDAIDDVLRRFRDSQEPFGGVQMLMIGDIQQLAPVVKENEWDILKEWYRTIYFFDSRALLGTQYVSIELMHIYRQKDSVFIDLLNRIRDKRIDEDLLNELNKRFDPTFEMNKADGYIILTTHKHQVQSINERKLEQINGTQCRFTASANGDFPEYSYPTDYELVLKEGAQVMFVKNDTSRDKLFYNGKIGVVEKLEKDRILVKCEGEKESITVLQSEWQNVKYSIDDKSKEIQEDVAGSFIQYPLKLAWAITIHKSQGLTFEKAVIDANAAFAHGQVYVALSRCKSLEGLVLGSKLTPRSIISDTTVLEFSQQVSKNQPNEQDLEISKYQYQKQLIFELFDFNQIVRLLKYCLKLNRENPGSFHVDFKIAIEQILASVNTDLFIVANNFKIQINRLLEQEPNVEKNELLQERLNKAGKYYTEKISLGALNILEGLSIESDNKSVKKNVVKTLAKIKSYLTVKYACFEQCQQGFDVKMFLDVRAKAAIEKSQQKAKLDSKREIIGITASTISHPELFERLKKWRMRKAEECERQIFEILHQKVLIQVVEQLPANLDELRRIKGIGKQKTKTFGGEIIDIINQYCSEKGMERHKSDGIDQMLIF